MGDGDKDRSEGLGWRSQEGNVSLRPRGRDEDPQKRSQPPDYMVCSAWVQSTRDPKAVLLGTHPRGSNCRSVQRFPQKKTNPRAA